MGNFGPGRFSTWYSLFVTLPKAPASVDASQLSNSEIYTKILKGYDSYKEGRTQNAADAFNEFRENNF